VTPPHARIWSHRAQLHLCQRRPRRSAPRSSRRRGAPTAASCSRQSLCSSHHRASRLSAAGRTCVAVATAALAETQRRCRWAARARTTASSSEAHCTCMLHCSALAKPQASHRCLGSASSTAATVIILLSASPRNQSANRRIRVGLCRARAPYAAPCDVDVLRHVITWLNKVSHLEEFFQIHPFLARCRAARAPSADPPRAGCKECSKSLYSSSSSRETSTWLLGCMQRLRG
jgi:hypothetical protein